MSMIRKRPLALLMLFLVLIILGHSVISLFQGKFQQAMIMAPLLIVVYIFGLAKNDDHDPDPNHREDPPSENQESEDDDAK
ncbi:MAG: hypothetical protein K9K64_11210 [Desulfohalobiaceae bacterium]|nr:hypothetical protein [Desulfohalobiaceae bacterium]